MYLSRPIGITGVLITLVFGWGFILGMFGGPSFGDRRGSMISMEERSLRIMGS